MSRQHPQNKVAKNYNMATFHQATLPNEETQPMNASDSPAKVAVDAGAIQLRAYHIYSEKGGSAMDNWLEAERSLVETARENFSFITGGEPNNRDIEI